MARSLDAILAELNQRTDPQRTSILNRLADLPNQEAAQVQGLDAKLSGAFDQILGGARQRGLGFSGIPLAEQSKYAATEYAPAVANLKAQTNQRKGTLEDALNGLGAQNYAQAQSIYGQDLDRDFQQQQFAESQRQFNESLALQRQNAARGANSGNFNLSGGVQSNSQATPAPKTDPVQQAAYNDVQTRVTQLAPAQIISDYNATKISAGYGNAKDKAKLAFYEALRPDLFRTAAVNQLANGSQLRY